MPRSKAVRRSLSAARHDELAWATVDRRVRNARIEIYAETMAAIDAEIARLTAFARSPDPEASEDEADENEPVIRAPFALDVDEREEAWGRLHEGIPGRWIVGSRHSATPGMAGGRPGSLLAIPAVFGVSARPVVNDITRARRRTPERMRAFYVCSDVHDVLAFGMFSVDSESASSQTGRSGERPTGAVTIVAQG